VEARYMVAVHKSHQSSSQVFFKIFFELPILETKVGLWVQWFSFLIRPQSSSPGLLPLQLSVIITICMLRCLKCNYRHLCARTAQAGAAPTARNRGRYDFERQTQSSKDNTTS